MSTVYCLEKVSCFSFKIRISILIQIYFCPNFKRTRAICDIWNKALSFSLQCNVNVIIKVTTTFSLAFVDNVVKYSWHRQFRNTLSKKICLFWNILLLCKKQGSFKMRPFFTHFNFIILDKAYFYQLLHSMCNQSKQYFWTQIWNH